MKTLKQKYLILALMVLGLVHSGCAKEKKDDNPSSAPGLTGFNPPGTGPGAGPGANFEYGGTATFVPESLDVFEEYTMRPMNDPQDIKINVNLVGYGNGYGGFITLQYRDRGETRTGYFTSLRREGSLIKSNAENHKHNRWVFEPENETIFYKGFFEDINGGVILIIDDIYLRGDGGGVEDSVGGSLWFKNHRPTYAPISPTSCWFVKVGPYDCRAWVSGDSIDITESPYPDSGYTKLGEFQNLSLEKAFNGELTE